MIASAVAFSIMGIAVKFAVQDIHPFQVVFFRSFLGLLMIMFSIKRKGMALLGTEHKVMTIRGISGFLALVLHFYTIKHLELGMAVTLNYMAPVFVALFSAKVLGETPGKGFFPLLGIAFLGVILMNAHVGFVWDPNIGIAVLSAVFAAIAYLSIRSLRGKESPLTVIFYFTAIATLGSLLFIPCWTWPQANTWISIAVIGVGSFYGQLWLTTAMHRAPAWLVSPFIYLNPVLSFIYGWLFFSERGSLIAWMGLGLIIASGALISIFGTKRKTEVTPALIQP